MRAGTAPISRLNEGPSVKESLHSIWRSVNSKRAVPILDQLARACRPRAAFRAATAAVVARRIPLRPSESGRPIPARTAELAALVDAPRERPAARRRHAARMGLAVGRWRRWLRSVRVHRRHLLSRQVRVENLEVGQIVGADVARGHLSQSYYLRL